MKLILGDCLEVMKSLDANSIDAIVTDPPYGWRFMGKAWDGEDIEKHTLRSVSKDRHPRISSDGIKRQSRLKPAESAGKYDTSLSANHSFQLWTEDWAREAFRVLKPGGHMLVFCGPRTYHRMASGVEDAGFEIRDQIQWIYGSGFPKSLDISKAIDKAAGAEREEYLKPIAYPDSDCWSTPNKKEDNSTIHGSFGISHEKIHAGNGMRKSSLPSTESAKQWSGWGTALKPANEPIVLARKPLSEKTVAANVLKWGTGGLNIDACRIDLKPGESTHGSGANQGNDIYGDYSNKRIGVPNVTSTQGRFPANLIFDEAASQMLDEQSGHTKSGGGKSSGKTFHGQEYIKDNNNRPLDMGGASRFFYVAKASKRERNQGLDTDPQTTDDGRPIPIDNPFQRGKTLRQNNHPTVKPIKLMEYLCKLITPPGGIILDPFMGSGTTGIAAKNLGFEFIGIEMNEEYMEIARKRIQ